MKGNFRNSIISGSSLFTFIPLYYILEYKMSVNIPKLHFLWDINCQFCTPHSPCHHVYMSRQTVSTIIRVTWYQIVDILKTFSDRCVFSAFRLALEENCIPFNSFRQKFIVRELWVFIFILWWEKMSMNGWFLIDALFLMK